MFNKDKDRLYLSLSHRFDQPGFHWSFLFAPKDAAKSTDGETTDYDAYRWHATNGGSKWRFSTNRVNQYKSISLCGRIILLKVNSNKREDMVGIIGGILSSIPLRTEEPEFDCVMWALDGLRALEERNVIEPLTVPHDQLRKAVREFGEDCMRKIINREIDIARDGASVIPTQDFRTTK